MSIRLGVGLIRIGREWGQVEQPVPSEADARAFLEHAVELGIRYFDAAPSYGVCEERFGRFLHSMPENMRRELTIATKFGEHWNRDAWRPCGPLLRRTAPEPRSEPRSSGPHRRAAIP